MVTGYPDLEEKTLQEWQDIVDLMARLARVRLCLIMRVIADEIEVLVASQTPDNPYRVGAREHLFGSGLYCEAVIQSQDCLLVADALTADAWCNNPDLRYGLVAYLGVPIRAPDGSPFGTLCLLDDQANVFSSDLQILLERMRDLIEGHLSLRAAMARAQLSSQAKSIFLSTVSHELRAPLHDILGYAQLLTRQVPSQAQYQLAVIQESGRQLLHLIDDILDFSRGEAKPILLDPGPLSLSRLTQHLTEVYQWRAARGDNRLLIRLATAATDWVLGDERRLLQVLRNLLENACKFTQGGQIELGIAQVEPPHQETAPPLCLMEFSVSDTGVGIPVEHQVRLFEPFHRLERDQREPGLGLGLAIGQQLVRAMGGQIRVESDPVARPGSRFSFRLRLPVSAPPGTEAGEAPIAGYRGRRRTLLIADDFPTSRRYLADCCAAWGFGVVLAGDGVQALAQWRAAAPPVDAALVDQFMPQLDGWGFLRRVRQSPSSADLPIVLISAAPPQRPSGFPPDLAFDAYAMKPLSETRLAQLLEEVLGVEWDYAAAPAGGGPVASGAPAWPAPGVVPGGQVQAFKQMVALGQLMAIQQWAQTMAERYPQHGPLWQDLMQRCATVDLPGLSRLAAACPEA